MRILLLIIFTISLVTAFAQDENKWVFKGETDGIKVYHQRTKGLSHVKLVTAFDKPRISKRTEQHLNFFHLFSGFNFERLHLLDLQFLFFGQFWEII